MFVKNTTELQEMRVKLKFASMRVRIKVTYCLV